MQELIVSGNYRRHRRDSGAMLLAVLFMLAIMVITAMAVAPVIIQQAKRDREEEMIHRGTEYARAVKKYYKKFGRYPPNLEALDNTNQLRFLRKRYKDPLTKDGQWRLLRYGDILSLVGGGAFGAQGIPGGLPGQVPGAAGAFGQAAAYGQAAQAGQMAALQQAAGANQNPFGASSTGASGSTNQQSFSLGPSQAQNAGPGGAQSDSTPGTSGAPGQTGAPGQAGSNTVFGSAAPGDRTFGGGPIVGVASRSKDPTIRIFNKKRTYDEWQFIYSPMMNLQNTLLRGPYNGQTIANMQIGIPPGQLNGPQGGPQPGAPGVQLPQQNQQQNQLPNQQVNPGGQFPPEQNPPPPQ